MGIMAAEARELGYGKIMMFFGKIFFHGCMTHKADFISFLK